MANKTCCVVGYRITSKNQIEYVKKALKSEIETALADGFTRFIGCFDTIVDLIFSEIIIDLMKTRPNLQLAAVIPYREYLQSLQKIPPIKAMLDNCSDITVIYEENVPGIFSHRNCFMAEHSDRIIAVHDGRKTGNAGQTVYIAQMLKKEVRIIFPKG